MELDVLLTTLKDLDTKISTILNYGIKILVMKQGKKGCLVTDGSKTHLLDAYEVNCHDTTGAGDAFNSGFIYGILEGKNIKESAMIGNFVASCCVQELGATTGLPSKSAVDKIR
jgi:ribokinase